MEEQRQRGICPEMSANLCGIELTQAADVRHLFLYFFILWKYFY